MPCAGFFDEWQTQAKAEVVTWLQAHAGNDPAAVAVGCPLTLGRPEVARWLMGKTEKGEGEKRCFVYG